MVARNLLADVLALPLPDRVELFEHLRDNLRNEPDLDPLTEEQKRILEERLAEYDANPDEGSTWEEVEARILKSPQGQP
jgi:putative addiction module component (TIGR02574 family)